MKHEGNCEEVVEVRVTVAQIQTLFEGFQKAQECMVQEMKELRDKVYHGLMLNSIASLSTIGLFVVTVIAFVVSFYGTMSNIKERVIKLEQVMETKNVRKQTVVVDSTSVKVNRN